MVNLFRQLSSKMDVRPMGVATRRQPTSSRLVTCSKLVLTPCGDGSLDHLNQVVEDPAIIELSTGLFEVGRTKEADIVIPIPTVSGRHALVSVDEEAKKMKVTDLGSTNRTYVNGQVLREMQSSEVAVGDVVVFGDPHIAAYILEELEETAQLTGEAS